MLSRAHRLVRSHDFQRVTRLGFKQSSRFFSVYVLPTPQGIARFGILTPKTLGSAPARNKIKRRIRGAAFALQNTHSADIVIRALPDSLSTSWQELSEDLRHLIEKASDKDA